MEGEGEVEAGPSGCCEAGREPVVRGRLDSGDLGEENLDRGLQGKGGD